MTKSPSVSVVVPVYRSAEILPELAKQLQPVLSECAGDYELILVNDGSPDNSWEVIQRLAQENHWITGINMMRNYGQHNALLAGIRAARFELTVTMDDDLQHPPAEIPKLLAKLDEGYDVVYGSPLQEQHGLWRDMASRLTKLILQNTMGIETARNASAFRVFRTSVNSAFEGYSGYFVSIDVLLTWGTNRFSAVEVNHAERYQGTSNYTFGKLVNHAMNMVTGFTTLPLQIASILGFGMTIFGMFILVYVIGRLVIEGGSVPGFPFLASIIAIFSGAQLFSLGIIGEYLSRMHYRIMGKPTYQIRLIVSSRTERAQQNQE